MNTVLSRLRYHLEPPDIARGAVIQADRHAVRLNPEALTTDVTEFEEALDKAARSGSEAERARHLARAVELYNGDLLPGHYQGWVIAEQRRLAERFFEAIRPLIRHLERTGDLETAISHARRAVAADPSREETTRDLMRLLLAAGRPEAALRPYQALKRELKRELGAVPSAALCEFARQIERGAATRPPSPTLPSPTGALPSLPGTVTFLVTDIEGADASETVRAALRELLGRGGPAVREAGDFLHAAFASARDALAGALAVGQALAKAAWPEAAGAPRVRMALHTGDVGPRPGEGSVLRHAIGLLAAAHGGQVLCSESTAALLRGGSDGDAGGLRAGLVDLGVYHLPEARLPERVFQIEWPEASPRHFPPIKANRAFRGELPPTYTRFFGREDEIAQLTEKLLLPEVRLLTLTGAGGTGKTRLACELAGRLFEPLAGAVGFVALTDLSDAGLIPDALRSALGLPRSPGVEPLEQVVEALCGCPPAGEPSLLVLDNFEHLVEGGAPLVRELLDRAPTLTLLVTSRQTLNLSAEHEFGVSPLPTPARGPGEPATLTPERLVAFDSVRLFLDRAQRAQPDFQITRTNAAAVADLVGRLEGIPLAIELAAAWTPVMSPAKMAAQLENRFAFLKGRKRDADARHQTLGAALDWSYNLLAPELQRFFARLSVFRGGWTEEAAEAVCDEPLALDYLAQLRECSLILAEGCENDLRFRMLETLREYGRERLAGRGDLRETRRRHLGWYLALAERAEPELDGGDQAEWLARLDQEQDNLRAALLWALENEPEASLRLAGSLGRFFDVKGHWAEGRAALVRALEHDTDRASLRAKATRWAGLLAWRWGNYAWARELLEQSLALQCALGDKRGIADSLNSLGNVVISQGDYPSGRALLEQSLVLQRVLGDKRGIAGSLNSLGNVVTGQGDYPLARALLEQSLALQRALGDRRGIAGSLNSLGNVAYVQGDYASAHALYEESLAIMRALGDRRSIAISLNCLGNVASGQGDHASARALYEGSLAIKRTLGDRQGIATALNNLGSVAYVQGDYASARARYGESLAIMRALGDRRSIAISLNCLGNVTCLQGDYASARSLYEESLTIKRTLGDKQGIAMSLNNLGSMALDQGDTAAARALFEESLAITRALGDKQGIALLLNNLGSMAVDQGDTDAGRAFSEESLAIRRTLCDRRGIALSLNNLGKAAFRRGDCSAAHTLLEESLALLQELGDKPNIAVSLNTSAGLAVAQGRRPENAGRAARLLGAGEALREAIGLFLTPGEGEQYNRDVTAVRAALGREAFAAAWAEGRAMTLDQAVAFARESGP